MATGSVAVMKTGSRTSLHVEAARACSHGINNTCHGNSLECPSIVKEITKGGGTHVNNSVQLCLDVWF